jgi:hypothetical protein
MTNEQLAYAAGIIDGEGCIRANKQKGKVSPVLRIHVTNTDERLVELLKGWFGGYIWKETKQYMPNAKIRFVWEVSAKRAEVVLRSIIPYLVLKKERAELALELRSTYH